MTDVAANLLTVKTRIARAAERVKRDPAEVTLIGAAKRKPVAMIEAAIAAGLTDIGENYVQEATEKQAMVTGHARWHMIGHLQRNKAKRAVEMFDLIQSVDSIELGRALGRHAEARQKAVHVLVEVNLGSEETKAGVAPAALPDLIAGLREVPCLNVDGLMTMPPPGPPESSRPFFRRLRELRNALGLQELSMGMTADFEVAVEEGATLVRVGTAIFGERPPK